MMLVVTDLKGKFTFEEEILGEGFHIYVLEVWAVGV